ncbi:MULTISPECIES: hypothetical protein [unclassified Spirillospora]|uniref:hypothetical protein n=1 Tax=unclassified Spirillospora TaxID=2642701 RepID=UPI0037198040
MIWAATGHLLLAAGLAGYAAAHTLPVLLAATVLWSLGDLLPRCAHRTRRDHRPEQAHSRPREPNISSS